MKQHLLSWKQSLLALTVLVSAGLSSCNRAEYAMLPKTSSYHGTERVVVAKPAPAPAVEAPAEAVATAPVAAPAVAAPAVAAAPRAAKAVASTTPAKPSMLQQALVKKALKGADKLAAKALVKKHKDVAESNKMQGKLRQGVILLLIGLLVQLLGGAIGSGIIILLGGILALVGIILIVLYLLDEL